MKPRVIVALAVTVVLGACGSQSEKPEEETELQRSHASYDDLLSDKLSTLEPLPLKSENPDNPATQAKIDLGHALYFDTRLSKDGNISCNSCHNLETYGVDLLPTSPGDAGENGDRNSPTTLNAAIHGSQFWDGRAADVEEQAGMPVLNPVEMAIPNEEFLMNRLKGIELYKALFAEAYPEQSDPFTYENMRKAIGAFERQLLTPSPYDQYLRGDKSALTLEEKKGLAAFVLTGCATCHDGAALGGSQLQKFGKFGDYWLETGSPHIDQGLMTQTGDSLDMFLFKVPSLRNISETGPYFHDGSVEDLGEAVHIMASLQLDKDLRNDQVKSIVTFLKALKGEVPAEYKSAPSALADNGEVVSEEVAE